MRLQTCLAAVSRLSSMQRVCPALLAKMCSIAGEPRRTSRDAKRWQSCFNMRFSAYIQLSLAPGGKAVRKHMQPGCLLHSSRVPRIDVHQNKPVMVRLNSGVVGSSRRICIHSRPVSQLPAPTMHRAPRRRRMGLHPASVEALPSVHARAPAEHKPYHIRQNPVN